MKPIYIVTIVAIVALILFSIFYNPSQMNPSDLNRMLSAFDNPDTYVKGKITVNFLQGTDSASATFIMSTYDLQLKSWNEELSSGLVDVPEGKEKEIAQKLIQEKYNTIVWVEPVRITSTG